MKKLALLLLWFPFVSSAEGLSQEVTFNLNRSIVKVHAVNQAGNNGVGSGVVIAKITWSPTVT